MNIVIIGCGLIGKKRAMALSDEDKLVACCDINEDLAVRFSKEFSCTHFTDYLELFSQVNCDSVIVSVINKFAKEIIIAALRKGKNVVAEKPLGRNLQEAKEIYSFLQGTLSHDSKMPILKTGFNHRFHPGIWQAKKMADEGVIGEIFNIRARYGHGGRAGMENEWRASKDLCGGGELLDQGVHVIDLIRWFGGEIKEIYGVADTKFWNMRVEDNATAILKTEKDVSASFQVSWTNWKNIFSFEIFGSKGFLKIEGLGGSYGPETLEVGIRKPEGGRPDIILHEFSAEDISWKMEWDEFKKAIKENRDPIGSGFDGFKANEVIDAIYRSNAENKKICL